MLSTEELETKIKRLQTEKMQINSELNRLKFELDEKE